MPCYRCHTRQTDPDRGASPWSRAVVAGEQVLVCPECQRDPAWRDALDRCGTCGSTHLAKALGMVVCRDCGAREAPAAGSARFLPPGVVIPAPSTEPVPGDPAAVGEPDSTRSTPRTQEGDAALAADVEAALARIFGRGTSRTGGPAGHPEDAADR